ncbi:MAG: type VI secretion system tube protein Hcp [Acidobacteriia bacterium]|nr:type VI secretion system tube protein Hcp [Terriglobia bacterium]
MQLRKIQWANPAVTALLAFAALAVMPPSVRADEKLIFGQISGVSCQGAGDNAFPGFAASSFSFGDTLATDAASGLATGKATFQNISVVKGLDDCTPVLFEAVAKGTQSATATLTVVAKGGKTPLLVIQLTSVIVNSDKFTEGAAHELDEVVTLSYRKITITHVPSGKTVTIDVATNSAT